MSLTDQPISPSKRKNSEDEIKEHLVIANHKIATACSKRGQQCLNSPRTMTKVHLQQVPLE